jgi:hypothetical protein
MNDDALKAAIALAVKSLPVSNVRIERLVQSHDIDRDVTRVRAEITFDLR